MLLGLFPMPWWGYLLVTLALTQITIFSVTIFLHRAQAHRALSLHPIVSHFFRFWLWLTTGMVTKEWAAIHRKHHAKVETPEDPHSPQTRGLLKVLLEGAELYRAEAKNLTTLERYGQGTPNDWLERHIYSPLNWLGVSILLAAQLVLFGLAGVIIWAIQMAWIPFWAAGVINGVGHYFGYRNYESSDASRNIFPIGFFIGGEELHNNHHAFATSAKFSTRWWEFDMGWSVIRVLQFFKLAQPKRTIPKVILEKNKLEIDENTIRALIYYRLQLLSNYTKEVILPVLKEEKRKANHTTRDLFSRARMLLTRDKQFINPEQYEKLSRLLQHIEPLRRAYQFRERLQCIWEKSTASPRELLQALQNWCIDAENSSLETLRLFALQLRSLSYA